jgi:ribonucleoside-diphosphate reductase alpha chain
MERIMEKMEITDQGTYSYEEALIKSIEYFDGDELAAKVFLDKYALRDNNQDLKECSPEDMHRRLAADFHRIEKKKFKNPMSYEEIFSYLDHFRKIIPQGSPMYGIGNPYQYVTVSNCYVVNSPLDSYSSICRTDEEIVNISKRRGGVGLDISNLRPEGSGTSNAAKTSTGIVSFMERYSNTIREVAQYGRRGALLISLSVHHPDIIKFITSKTDLSKITGANISIRLTDEFLNAVKKDEEYEIRWPVDSNDPKISKKIKAKEVWGKIIHNAWLSGEPGLLFWDNIINESIPDCYSELGFKSISTNPCSEIILDGGGACILNAVNLNAYVKNPFAKDSYLDFDQLYKDVQIAQRFSDNIIDIDMEHVDRIIKKIKSDPEPMEIKRNEINLWKNIKNKTETGRRTGTGITGLGDAIASCGIKYGSKKSIEFVDRVYKTLKLGCYRSSVDMAKEIGTFKVWDHELEKNNPFLLRIKDEDINLWNDMKKYGRRNIALLTSSPGGSISLEAQTTSGIEPLYMISSTRKKKVNPSDEGVRVDEVDINGDSWQHFEIYHHKVKEWMEITGETDITKSPWYGCCAEDINWENRVKLQAAAGKNICHSISSTINLPEDVKEEVVAKIYETAWKEGIKGITVYRKNSRSGVLIDTKDKEKIKKTDAPKRPESLFGEVFHTSVKGEIYFVVVGVFHGDPYEVFAGKDDKILKSIKDVVIKKIKRGKYSLSDRRDIDNVLHEDISKYITEDQEALTRMISMSLRHGADVNYVVHQLEKTHGPLQGYSKAISRILKKYIKDDSTVSGEECPECGGTLVRESGCATCRNCTWTKCN